MNANDLFFKVEINDDEIDEEFENLLDDQPKPKKKSKGKKKSGNKAPSPNPGNANDISTETHKKASDALKSAEALLAQTDDLNVDDVSLDSDDLKDLDPELAGIEPDKPKTPKSTKTKFTKNISDDDDNDQGTNDDNNQGTNDDDDAEVEETPKVVKQKYKPKKKTYRKTTETETKVEYDDVFDYFSANFYNFLYSVDEPQIAEQYMTRMESLAPIVFAGEEKFKETKMSFLSLPIKIVPFGHWNNISSHPLKVPSLIEENTDVRQVLTDQLSKLTKMKDEANSKREEESAKEIDRAIKLTNQSLKSAFPKPEFLVSDYMQLQHSTLNTSLSEVEIQVKFQSIKNCTSKDKYYISVDIPGIGTFKSKRLSGQNNDNLNESISQNYDPRRLANAVARGGKVSVGDKSASFSLGELSHQSTVEITSNASGVIIVFSVSIRTPLNGEKTTYEIEEFFCCPTILTEALPYTPAPTPVRPKPKPAPAPKQAPAPARAPAPHLVLLKQDELNIFWGTKATAILADPTMINYFNKNNYPVPQEYADQVKHFIQKMKDFEKLQQEGTLDPNQYLSDLKAALKREQDKMPSIPPEDKNIRQLLVDSLQEEVIEIENMLAEEDE